MSEKLTLREKLHIGEKRTDGEKPRMSKKLKKGIIAAACVVGVCGAVRGGLTIDDYVAFPYGRDVVEGAHTQEATTDQLYNYGI